MTKEAVRPDKCPHCGGQVCSIEYWHGSPEHYDGTSEYACADRKGCGWRVGRWSRLEIPAGYVESRCGSRGIVPVQIKKR